MFNKCNLVSKNISKQNLSESASLNYILDVFTAALPSAGVVQHVEHMILMLGGEVN